MHLRQGFVASEPNESTSTIHDGSLEAAQSSVLNHSTVHTARLNGRNRTGLKDSTDDQVSEDVDHQGTGEKESFHVSPDSTIFPDTSSHRPEPLLQYKDDPPWHVLPELTYDELNDMLERDGKGRAAGSTFTHLAMQSSRTIYLHIEAKEDLAIWLADCETRGITTTSVLPLC